MKLDFDELSVALSADVFAEARRHLLRNDGQEDLCFALWWPSRGIRRFSAVLGRLILPRAEDRHVHGNASFESQYFERALTEAASSNAGLALMHSHPHGKGWQGMSEDDVVAEQGHAAAAFGATGLPLVGLTLAGDEAWSGRFWPRTGARRYQRRWCDTVRVVGPPLAVSFNPMTKPPPAHTTEQIRTVSSWGEEAQAHLARLRVGLVGAGSVGGFIGEALARTGIRDVVVIDFDKVEARNLDRLLFATRSDIGALKATLLATRLNKTTTSKDFVVKAVTLPVYEEDGYRAALDCDILFCCVDRPWGRAVLNFVAYAHLIPVVDGGIHARTNRRGQLAAADWRALTAMPGRICLQCAKQFDPGLVQVEREGLLDSPKYIEGLPTDHPLKTSENVFGFSMSCAGLQFAQMLATVINPLGRPDHGLQRYHFVGGFMEDPEHGTCHSSCLYPTFTARGDSLPLSGVRQTTASAPGKRRSSLLRRVMAALKRNRPKPG